MCGKYRIAWDQHEAAPGRIFSRGCGSIRRQSFPAGYRAQPGGAGQDGGGLAGDALWLANAGDEAPFDQRPQRDRGAAEDVRAAS